VILCRHRQRSLRCWKQYCAGRVTGRRLAELRLPGNAKVLSGLHRWRSIARQQRHQRMALIRAARHFNGRLLRRACAALLHRLGRIRRHRLDALSFVASRAPEVSRFWLLQWRMAVGNWRREQVKEKEAILQWYLVLGTSVLYTWHRWLQRRRWKKERQAEASQLFCRAAKAAAIRSVFWRFDEAREAETEVARVRAAQRHRKNVEVAFRAGQHWRTHAYIRSKSHRGFVRRQPLHFQEQRHPDPGKSLMDSWTPSLNDSWPSSIAERGRFANAEVWSH